MDDSARRAVPIALWYDLPQSDAKRVVAAVARVAEQNQVVPRAVAALEAVVGLVVGSHDLVDLRLSKLVEAAAAHEAHATRSDGREAGKAGEVTGERGDVEAVANGAAISRARSRLVAAAAPFLSCLESLALCVEAPVPSVPLNEAYGLALAQRTRVGEVGDPSACAARPR